MNFSVSWLFRLDVRMSSQISEFDSRPAHARVVMFKVAFRHGFLQDSFSPVRIIPPVTRTHIVLIFHSSAVSTNREKPAHNETEKGQNF
jgi:hypothetical protein